MASTSQWSQSSTISIRKSRNWPRTLTGSFDRMTAICNFAISKWACHSNVYQRSNCNPWGYTYSQLPISYLWKACRGLVITCVRMYQTLASWTTQRLIIMHTNLLGLNGSPSPTSKHGSSASVSNYPNGPVGIWLLHFGGIRIAAWSST